MKSKRIIVVGATGRVGREMLSILHEICIPRENISAAASSRSQGKFLDYGNGKIEVKIKDLFRHTIPRGGIIPYGYYSEVN